MVDRGWLTLQGNITCTSIFMGRENNKTDTRGGALGAIAPPPPARRTVAASSLLKHYIRACAHQIKPIDPVIYCPCFCVFYQNRPIIGKITISFLQELNLSIQYIITFFNGCAYYMSGLHLRGGGGEGGNSPPRTGRFINIHFVQL